jgi:hypothetical protein
MREEPHHEAAPIAPTWAPAVPPAPPAAFHAVSEHDDSAEEAHRPARRRRAEGEAAAPAPAALELVETRDESIAPPVVVEDELPRRTKPRRRRGGGVAEEPLQLVETQPGSDTAPPTP